MKNDNCSSKKINARQNTKNRGRTSEQTSTKGPINQDIELLAPQACDPNALFRAYCRQEVESEESEQPDGCVNCDIHCCKGWTTFRKHCMCFNKGFCVCFIDFIATICCLALCCWDCVSNDTGGRRPVKKLPSQDVIHKSHDDKKLSVNIGGNPAPK